MAPSSAYAVKQRKVNTGDYTAPQSPLATLYGQVSPLPPVRPTGLPNSPLSDMGDSVLTGRTGALTIPQPSAMKITPPSSSARAPVPAAPRPALSPTDPASAALQPPTGYAPSASGSQSFSPWPAGSSLGQLPGMIVDPNAPQGGSVSSVPSTQQRWPALFGDPSSAPPSWLPAGQLFQPYPGPSPSPAASSPSSGSPFANGVNDLTLNPVYQQVVASGTKNINDADTAALASAKQALLGYGAIAPDAASNLSTLFQGDPNNPILGALSDSMTAQAAKNNPNATLNQLAYNDQQRVGQLDTDLNDKNLFYSSTRAAKLADDANTYRGEQSSATNDLANALAGIYGNVLNVKQTALEDKNNALNQAFQDELALAQQGGGAPPGQTTTTPGTPSGSGTTAAATPSSPEDLVQSYVNAIANGGQTNPPGWVNSVTPQGYQGALAQAASSNGPGGPTGVIPTPGKSGIIARLLANSVAG